MLINWKENFICIDFISLYLFYLYVFIFILFIYIYLLVCNTTTIVVYIIFLSLLTVLGWHLIINLYSFQV